jgi:hypothetical protein
MYRIGLDFWQCFVVGYKQEAKVVECYLIWNDKIGKSLLEILGNFSGLLFHTVYCHLVCDLLVSEDTSKGQGDPLGIGHYELKVKKGSRALDHFSTHGVCHFQCIWLPFIDFGDRRKHFKTNFKYFYGLTSQWFCPPENYKMRAVSVDMNPVQNSLYFNANVSVVLWRGSLVDFMRWFWVHSGSGLTVQLGRAWCTLPVSRWVWRRSETASSLGTHSIACSEKKAAITPCFRIKY